MNITDLTPGQQIIAQIHEQGCPTNEFPARFVGSWMTERGTHVAMFLFQPSGSDVWHNLSIQSMTSSGPWTVAHTHMLFTVRAEQFVTITELAGHIAFDAVATPELEQKIIRVLGMDPECAHGETLIGEDAAERAYNEIQVEV